MTTPLREAIEGLRRAFPPRPLDADRAFGEGGTTYLSGHDFVRGASGKAWDALDPAFIEFHHDAAVFLTPEFFVEYLPAYVGALLSKSPEIRNLPTFVRGLLTRGSDPAWFDARIERLSVEQKRAVARAFEALEAAAEYEHNKQDLSKVLDSYWRTYADRS